ncbi:hypothetical protein IMZ48_04550 [Candidatus Bathyarchaeota archaeon]|nr:hypothetical protein [Candidatus Bathyarchaeota archaeon]
MGVIKSLTFSPHGRSVVAAVSQTTSTRYSGQPYLGQPSDESGYSIYVFHLDNIDEGNLVSPSRSVPSSICREPIGMSQDGNRFLFQHANNWVWSFDPNGGNGEYTQHFPVPLEFIPGDNRKPAPVQTVGGGFAFCARDKLAVVQNGLTFEEKVL